jgi:hypothetical protein
MSVNDYLTGEVGFTPNGSHTRTTDLSSAVTLTRPDGAINLMIQPLTQNVRITLDGTTPTASVGFQLTAGEIYVFPVPSASVKVIEESASAESQHQWLD